MMQPKKIILIDGKTGGGQILRTAIGLAAITNQPIKVVNIRGARCDGGGLRPQHLIGVKTAGEFCDAKIKGADLGSAEIEFTPDELRYENKKIDIGTAGSIALLLQTLLPILIFTEKKICVEITGGTDGAWAPPILYFKHIVLPLLKKIGVSAEIAIKRFGFYPKGNGLVKITVDPCGQGLRSLQLTNRGNLKSVKGISIAASLPAHIATRQAEAVKNFLKNKNYDPIIEKKVVESKSPGTSVNLWAEFDNSIMGANALGERGKPAEAIGEQAAKELIQSIDSQAALDKHMADQILPYLAIAHGKSTVGVEEITAHCKTNISVCEKILGCKFDVDKKNRRIEIEGIGLSK